jgi:hypothetical protein
VRLDHLLSKEHFSWHRQAEGHHVSECLTVVRSWVER